MHIVLAERGLQRSQQNAVDDSGSDSKAEHEDGSDEADARGGERAQPAEQRRHADHERERRADGRHNVRDRHPFRGRVVGVERAGGDDRRGVDAGARRVQVPDGHGVEPEGALPRRAVRRFFGAAPVAVGALAVVP